MRFAHHDVELGGTDGAALSPGEHFGLEQEAAVDVDDHLQRALQVDIEQGEALVAVESSEPLLDDQGLTEDAGRLRQRHRKPPLQVRPPGEGRVVVGVAELVCRRLRRVDAARPVEEHE